jgi:hypothetical protein
MKQYNNPFCLIISKSARLAEGMYLRVKRVIHFRLICEIVLLGFVHYRNIKLQLFGSCIMLLLLSRNVEVKIYKTIILPVVLYGVKLGL